MSNRPSRAQRLARLHAAIAAPLQPPQDDPPQQVVDWMTKLRSLQGVPFWYLVPDARMLPPESLRFFQLDPNWIECLSDGAMSLGRAFTGGVSKETALTASVREAAASRRRHPRSRALGVEPPLSGALGPVSGFMLRSVLVSAVKGLRIQAFSDAAATKPLELIRLDTISPGLILGLVDGAVASITVTGPPEALHFGVLPANQQVLVDNIDVRDPQTGVLLRDEQQAVINYPLAASDWRDQSNRVFDIAALAGHLQAAASFTGSYTAAQFGLQMVEEAESAIVTISAPGALSKGANA